MLARLFGPQSKDLPDAALAAAGMLRYGLVYNDCTRNDAG